MVQFAYNGTGFEARYGSEGGGLPAGRHKVIIEKSEMVPTKDHHVTKKEYLKFTLKCIEGLANGGTQEDRLNIHNSSPQAVAIANSQLAAYCLVTIQRVVFNATEELHNIPFYIEVRQQRNNPEYTESAKLYDINGNEPGKGVSPQVQAQPVVPPQGFGPTGGMPPQQQWQPPQGQPPQQQPTQQWQPPQ